jgi:DNA repair exonuclease SbcCD ATPase subunit
MEIKKLNLHNFKKFTDLSLDFGPGLNLVWGPNESGKSTIHEAMLCALFGRERGKPIESWAGGSCSIEMTFADEGKTYLLERLVTQGTVSLGTVTADGLADVLTSKDQVEAEITERLGISSRSVFENTVSIRQTNMSALKDKDLETIAGEIERVFTGAEHTSAAEVILQLMSARDGIKGRARPTNPREYDVLSDQLSRIAENLADARRSREQISNLEEEMAGLQTRVERDSERLGIIEGLLERHRRWTELRSKESELDERHKQCFSSLKNARETLADLTDTQSELVNYADLVGKDEEIAEHLTKVSGRRAEMEDRISEYDAVKDHVTSSKSGHRALICLEGAIVLGLFGLALGYMWNPWALLLLLPAAACAMWYMHFRGLSRTAEIDHVNELANNAREVLDQIEAEESTILNYVNAQDSVQAWARIKEYRRLAAHARELEATLSGVLAGRKLAELESDEVEWARGLSAIRRELEDDYAGYDPTTEESESWRSESAALMHSLPPAEARLHEISGSLEAERRNSHDLAALEGEIDYLHMRRDELDFTWRAYDEAISTLSEITQSITEEYMPDLCREAAKLMEQITGGRYTSISIGTGGKIAVDGPEKSGIAPTSLSIGTLDQLYLSLRLICGRLIASGRKLPVILDDPFASFDRSRLDNALDLLHDLAKSYQILLLTHDPYVLERLKSTPTTILNIGGNDKL